MDALEMKRRIADYLSSHNIMTLATVSPEGMPAVRTLEYASNGAIVYFATFGGSKKIEHIRKNPHVAYTVDEDYRDWMTIQGVKIEGVATILSDPDSIEQAERFYMAKFPFVADFPPNPDLIFVRIEPATGYFLDYTKGFSHTDTIVF
ncbi:MAG TPA: pyridoxamine 5'-phosphate oxidase family protein [Syntrophales bacterium]|nr:pyridoxamine 5'-phosphate oxidase family protein [Syntrophales bacterium]HQA82388.1 pyridoxamine 5'-phosphate oxidase family protein [Syntrophales bacterium]